MSDGPKAVTVFTVVTLLLLLPLLQHIYLYA